MTTAPTDSLPTLNYQIGDAPNVREVFGTSSNPECTAATKQALVDVRRYNQKSYKRTLKMIGNAVLRYARSSNPVVQERITAIKTAWSQGYRLKTLSEHFTDFELYAAGIAVRNVSCNQYAIHLDNQVLSRRQLVRRYNIGLSRMNEILRTPPTAPVSRLVKRERELESVKSILHLSNEEVKNQTGFGSFRILSARWVLGIWVDGTPKKTPSVPVVSANPVTTPRATTPLKGTSELVRMAIGQSPEKAVRFAQVVDQGPRDITRTVACKTEQTALEYALKVDKAPHKETLAAMTSEQGVPMYLNAVMGISADNVDMEWVTKAVEFISGTNV